MKIESIETFLGDEVVVVRVRTDDGAEGIGQTAPFGAPITAQVLHAMVAPFFLGRDPWDVETLVNECLRRQYKFPSTFIYRALCGVDTALWDLLGRAAGQPVHKLIGGQVRDSVPMYASSMSRSVTPEQESERIQQLVTDHGFRGAKVRVGSGLGRDEDAWPGRSEQLVSHMRAAMGDDFDLLADANGAYSVGGAIRLGRILEGNGFYHFEEPCPFSDIERTAEVAAALDIPVAGGEQDNSLPQFDRMIRDRAVDIVQPDVGYIGGISRARKVATLAEVAGIPCTPHCSNNSMLQLFSLHLVAASTACTQYQEWGIESTWSTVGIYEPMLNVVDGAIMVPQTPGWGVEIVQSFLRDAVHTISHIRDGAAALSMP